MNIKNAIIVFCIICICATGWGFICGNFPMIVGVVGGLYLGNDAAKIAFKFFPLYGITK